jgi:hypothetical protein
VVVARTAADPHALLGGVLSLLAGLLLIGGLLGFRVRRRRR